MNSVLFVLLLVLIDQISKIAMKVISSVNSESFTIIKNFSISPMQKILVQHFQF